MLTTIDVKFIFDSARLGLFSSANILQWLLIIVVFVVVVFDDDTYYWVYLSSEHPFQVYYKVRQLICYKMGWSVITKCDKCCDDYYKVRHNNATITELKISFVSVFVRFVREMVLWKARKTSLTF